MIGQVKEALLKRISFGRRSFLKLAGLSSLAAVFMPFKSKSARARTILNRNWWRSREIWSTADSEYKSVEYCKQHNLNATRADSGIISANLDNVWRRFDIRELSQGFMEWGCSERYFYYDERIDPGPDGPPTVRKNGGIHHGTVATYGNWIGRRDSSFHLNNTVKGTALCPSRTTILELLPVLEQLKIDDPPDRLEQYYEIMRGIYSDIDNFDKTKMLTLELYTQSTAGTLYDAGLKETHSFSNMMANPICTIAFLQPEYPQLNYFDPNGSGGYNSFRYGVHFEVRAIPQVIHCWAANMGNEYDKFDYENADDPIALYGYWVNFLHTFYHRGRANVTAVIYHVTEQFDNTPGDPGRGIRVIPPL
jgi:hypothetical protein